MKWMNVISPLWLKVLLLTFGILFIAIGFFYPVSGDINEFTLHFISVLVEICLGGFITYAILDEIFKHDKRERLFLIFLLSNGQIAVYSKYILSIALTSFVPQMALDERPKMMEFIEKIDKQILILDSDVLDAMRDGYELWEKIFFKKNSIEPKNEYPEIILKIYDETNNQIKYIKKLMHFMEDASINIEQSYIFYEFDLGSEFFEDAINNFRNAKKIGGKDQGLMIYLHSLLSMLIHIYSFCLNYDKSLPKLEEVEIYKYGFTFKIKKMKWWM